MAGPRRDRTGFRAHCRDGRERYRQRWAHRPGATGRDQLTRVRHTGLLQQQPRLDREVFSKDDALREVPAGASGVASGLPDEALRRMPGAGPVLMAVAKLMAHRFDRRETRVFGSAR